MTGIPGRLWAQEVKFSARSAFSVRIPYHRHGDANDSAGSLVMKEIARDVLREPWLVNVGVTGVATFLVRSGSPSDSVAVVLSDIRPFGDTLFRDFPLSRVMVPSLAGITLRWAARSDTTAFFGQILPLYAFQPGDTLVFPCPISPFDPETDTLLAVDFRMRFDPPGSAKFLAYTGLIHDYYASASLLDTVGRMIAPVRYDDPERYVINAMKGLEALRVIRIIRERGFEDRLAVSVYDPKGLKTKLTEVNRWTLTLVHNLAEWKQKQVAGNGGVAPAEAGDFLADRLLFYIRRSFLMDLQQGSVYRDCLQNFFADPLNPAADTVYREMLADMFPRIPADSARAQFGRLATGIGCSRAEGFIRSGDHTTAFELLRSIRPLLRDAEFPCQELLSEAAGGIYHSFVGIAESCLRKGNWSMAGSYLERAASYFAGHRQFLLSDSAYRRVYSALFFLRNGGCDRLLDEGRFAEALACYRDLEQSWPEEQLAGARDELDRKISESLAGLSRSAVTQSEQALRRADADSALVLYEMANRYRDSATVRIRPDGRIDSLAPAMMRLKTAHLCSEAMTALDKRQFARSVALFEEVRSVEDKYQMERDSECDSAYRRAMKFHLLVRLISSRKLIWNHQPDSARALLAAISRSAGELSLGGDPDLSASIERFRNAIDEERCKVLGDSINLMEVKAGRCTMLHSFPAAVSSWRSAIRTAASEPRCRFDTLAWHDSVNRYLPPARYQETLARIDAMAASGDYTSCARTVRENHEFFEKYALQRFGLRPVLLQDYVLEKGNPYLTLEALRLQADSGWSDDLFLLLKMLDRQGMTPDRTASLQVKAAEFMAGSDLAKGDPPDPRVRFKELGVESAWFSTFRKAYEAGLTRLKKAKAQ